MNPSRTPHSEPRSFTSTPPVAVVIDDDPEIRGVHRQLLEQLGFEVVITTNAHDGIAAVREFSPTVTFLDVTMPGMDGFAATARIRAESSTYVVMVSALADEIDVVQGLAAGADDYVVKPFRPRELRARVEAMMRRPRNQPELAPVTALAAVATPAPEVGLWSVGDAAPSTLSLASAGNGVLPAPRTAATARAASVGAPAPARTALATVPVHPGSSGAPASPGAPEPAAARPEPVLPAPRAEPQAVAETVPEPVPDAAPTFVDETPLVHGALALLPHAGTLTVDGTEVTLEGEELALMTSLMQSGPRVRSTANLVLALRGEGYVTTYFVTDADKRTVAERMESLRRRIGDTGPTPLWIEPVRGIGYRMTAG